MTYFYVSAIRNPGEKPRLVAGPYQTHGAALDRVSDVRKLASDRDPWSDFYLWGTSSSDILVITALDPNWSPQRRTP